MNRIKNIFYIVVLIVAVQLINNKLFAQGPPPPPPPPISIPIDGGIGILIAAGAAYGAKRAYDKKKNKPV